MIIRNVVLVDLKPAGAPEGNEPVHHERMNQ